MKLLSCGFCGGVGHVEERLCACASGDPDCSHKTRAIPCEDCEGTGRGGCEVCGETRLEESPLCQTCKAAQDRDLICIYNALKQALGSNELVWWAEETASKIREGAR